MKSDTSSDTNKIFKFQLPFTIHQVIHLEELEITQDHSHFT